MLDRSELKALPVLVQYGNNKKLKRAQGPVRLFRSRANGSINTVVPRIYDIRSTRFVRPYTRHTCALDICVETSVHITPCTDIAESPGVVLYQSRNTYEMIRYSEQVFVLARVCLSCIKHVMLVEMATYYMLTTAKSVGYNGLPGTPL